MRGVSPPHGDERTPHLPVTCQIPFPMFDGCIFMNSRPVSHVLQAELESLPT